MTGVTACQELIHQAIFRKADAIIVHHGYFWKGEDPCLVGMKYQRIRKLIQHDISLWRTICLLMFIQKWVITCN